jgi:ribosomal protein S18 acetylase RimI-like enzyme
MRLLPDLRVPPSRAVELRDLLIRRPDETLFHLAVLEERGVMSIPGESPFAFYGWPEIGPLTAAVFVGGSWFASAHAPNPADAAAVGARVRELRLRRSVGERAATDAFWTAWSDGHVKTVLCHDQQLMVARPGDVPVLDLPGLRPAVPSEESMVHDAAAEMQLEELGVDPRIEEPSIFRAQVSERLRGGRTWVLLENGELVFKAEVALKSRLGAQIGGVWVPRASRGRGFASRGVGDLTRRLLGQVPAVSLHVHERNAPALAAYSRAGYRAVLPFRLLRGLPLPIPAKAVP